MTTAKRTLPYVLTLSAFAVAEILLSAFVFPLVAKNATAAELFSLLSALLAVVPPFLAIGVSVPLLRTRPFSYALFPMGVYAAIDLFTAVPLSLISYSAASSAPYGLLLASYMITSAVTSLLFLGALLLGYALFMNGKPFTDASARIFDISDVGARPVLLIATMLTLYHLVREIIGMVRYAQDKLFVLSARDLLFMLLYLIFFLLLGVFSFAVGRISERIFPPLLLEDGEDTEEADDYEE